MNHNSFELGRGPTGHSCIGDPFICINQLPCSMLLLNLCLSVNSLMVVCFVAPASVYPPVASMSCFTNKGQKEKKNIVLCNYPSIQDINSQEWLNSQLKIVPN